MNNITQTSKDLKKKLSFDDYSKPVSLHAGTTAEQPGDTKVGMQDSITTSQFANAPADQLNGKMAQWQTGVTAGQSSSMPESQQSGLTATRDTSEIASRQNAMPAGPQDGLPVNQDQHDSTMVKQYASKTPSKKIDADEKKVGKIKATYYLTKEDNKVLTDIYIKRLQADNKTDKSALISEAIKLLYKRECKTNFN